LERLLSCSGMQPQSFPVSGRPRLGMCSDHRCHTRRPATKADDDVDLLPLHYRGAPRRTRVHAEYDDEFFTWISRAGNSDKVCTITPTDSRSTKDKQIMANLPPDITQNGDGPEAGSYH
jgi:hypothetical protein